MRKHKSSTKWPKGQAKAQHHSSEGMFAKRPSEHQCFLMRKSNQVAVSQILFFLLPATSLPPEILEILSAPTPLILPHYCCNLVYVHPWFPTEGPCHAPCVNLSRRAVGWQIRYSMGTWLFVAQKSSALTEQVHGKASSFAWIPISNVIHHGLAQSFNISCR